MQDLYELIPNKFYFLAISKSFAANPEEFMYMSVDESVFPKIGSYFGPPCLSDIYKYCVNMELILAKYEYKIIHWSSYLNGEIFTNTLFLIGTLLLIVYRKSPAEVMSVIKKIGNKHLIPFRDASKNERATLQMDYYFIALYKAIKYHWFDLHSFDASEYDRLATLAAGDMNWIIPGKFIALSHPGLHSQPLHMYAEYFKKNNVFSIIQANEADYDIKTFERFGVHHFKMDFPDGTPPSKDITRHFLSLTECINKAFAVHCHAGLGRTGTLIAAYIINNYNLSAREAIAWVRLCRPGSIIGIQQRFLELNYNWLSSFKIACTEYFENDFKLIFELLNH